MTQCLNLYQSPISAAKYKAGASNITFEGARNINSKLKNAFDGTSSFEEFHSALGKAMQFAPKSAQEAFANSTDLLQRFHAGMSPEVFQASNAKIMSMASQFANADIKGALKASDMIPYLSGARATSTEASTGATMAAEAIGGANEAITSAKRIAKAFASSDAGKAVGVGLGLAAVVGLMTETTKSPRAKSLNAYRPETTASTANHVPGEGVTGSYSSNPPRTQTSGASASVQQAIVAPINQATNTEVNMKTDDPQRAAELSKMVARSSGSGNTTVTNNYRNNNLTSLRNKQKLREALDG